jgi:NDP-sugar pyrophosphorylase family protein
MKAVLLVGGQGTRLRPLTFSIPKPLLPVGERPILQIIIEQLKDAGFTELVLATGYQAELIQAFCGDGSRFGVAVRYVKEEQPLGTAGPLALVRDRVAPGEGLLLMNGDILTALDFRRFVTSAQGNGCDLTVGYTTYLHSMPFGVLTIRGDRVEGIVEKPSQEHRISAGIYWVGAGALPLVPAGAFFTVPDLMRALIAAGRPVGAYRITESWLGLESVEHFEQAVREAANAQRP